MARRCLPARQRLLCAELPGLVVACIADALRLTFDLVIAVLAEPGDCSLCAFDDGLAGRSSAPHYRRHLLTDALLTADA